MNMFLIVDDQAQDGVQLLKALNDVAQLDHQGDGLYQVQGDDKTIREVTDQYPDAVMKLEVA